jgi:hypothetical protein
MAAFFLRGENDHEDRTTSSRTARLLGSGATKVALVEAGATLLQSGPVGEVREIDLMAYLDAHCVQPGGGR